MKTKSQQKCGKCKKTFSSEKSKEFCPICEKEMRLSILEKKSKVVFKTKIGKSVPNPSMSYKFDLFKINSSKLPLFVFPDNRRKISKAQISSLCKCLYSGNHFDSPIVVNKVENLYRIVDGNHRIEAIKKVIKIHPKYNIDVLLIEYKNLDKDGEIEAFRRWNTGKIQTTDDFIQSVAHKIDFIRWLKKDFPIEVTIYKRPTTLGVRLLCGALIAAKKYDDTGYGLKRDNFLNDLNSLDEKDFDFIKGWVKKYVEIFGKPEQGNIYYSTTPFTAATYIAYEYQDSKILVDKFKDKIVGDEEIIEFSKFSGRIANKKMIQLMKDKLKLKYKLNLG